MEWSVLFHSYAISSASGGETTLNTSVLRMGLLGTIHCVRLVAQLQIPHQLDIGQDIYVLRINFSHIFTFQPLFLRRTLALART